MKKNIIKKLFILIARKLGLALIEQSNLKFINKDNNNKTIIMPSFGIFTGGLYLSEFLNQFSYQGKINIGFIYRNKIYNYNLKAVLK